MYNTAFCWYVNLQGNLTYERLDLLGSDFEGWVGCGNSFHFLETGRMKYRTRICLLKRDHIITRQTRARYYSYKYHEPPSRQLAGSFSRGSTKPVSHHPKKKHYCSFFLPTKNNSWSGVNAIESNIRTLKKIRSYNPQSPEKTV